MNSSQIKACRDNQIRILAARKDGDEQAARSLYYRCVRFYLRVYRYSEMRANGPSHYSKWKWEWCEHEGKLIVSHWNRLNTELMPYGLMWECPGLYPILVDENNNNPVELFWY